MAKLVDARDLKSLDLNRSCLFESGSGHHLDFRQGPALRPVLHRDNARDFVPETTQAGGAGIARRAATRERGRSNDAESNGRKRLQGTILARKYRTANSAGTNLFRQV